MRKLRRQIVKSVVAEYSADWIYVHGHGHIASKLDLKAAFYILLHYLLEQGTYSYLQICSACKCNISNLTVYSDNNANVMSDSTLHIRLLYYIKYFAFYHY
jgi:hypothetical protein